MNGFSVLAMLAVTAVVVLGSMFLVIRVDPAARVDRLRSARRARLDAAMLMDEIDAFRRQSAEH